MTYLLHFRHKKNFPQKCVPLLFMCLLKSRETLKGFTDRPTNRWMVGEMDRRTDGQMDKRIRKQMGRWMDTHTDG